MSKYPVMDFTFDPSLWIVSDGGLFQDYVYYGWVIANDTSIIWKGRGQVPGNHIQFDSLRSESSGFLHALKVVYANLQVHDHLATSVTLASDNKVLIERVQQFQPSQERPPKMYVQPHTIRISSVRLTESWLI